MGHPTAQLIAISNEIRKGSFIGFCASKTFRVSVMAFGDFSSKIADHVARGELSGQIGSIPFTVHIDTSIPLTPEEIALVQRGDDIFTNDAVYQRLYAYYTDPSMPSGEMMPYGVAKAREGDPYQWIGNQLERTLSQ